MENIFTYKWLYWSIKQKRKKRSFLFSCLQCCGKWKYPNGVSVTQTETVQVFILHAKETHPPYLTFWLQFPSLVLDWCDLRTCNENTGVFTQNLAFLRSFTWFTVSLCRIRWAKALCVVLEWEDRLRLKLRIITLSQENKTGKNERNLSKICNQLYQSHTTEGYHQWGPVPGNRMSLLLWEQIVDMRRNAKRRAAERKKKEKKNRKMQPIMREQWQCFRKQLAVVISNDSWPHFSSISRLVIDS